MFCGLTLPSQSIRSNSKIQSRLTGSQSTSFRIKLMFLIFLHSVQLWIAYRWKFDQRPLDNMWSMDVLFPKDSVPPFYDHGYCLDNSAQLGDKVVRMRLEAPMQAYTREDGIMITPSNTKNDHFCWKIFAHQNMGLTAWKEYKKDTTMSVMLLCIQRSSLFRHKMRVGEGDIFKDHYFIRCDYCSKKSHPHHVMTIVQRGQRNSWQTKILLLPYAPCYCYC
jgi:hypothetical protein